MRVKLVYYGSADNDDLARLGVELPPGTVTVLVAGFPGSRDPEAPLRDWEDKIAILAVVEV